MRRKRCTGNSTVNEKNTCLFTYTLYKSIIPDFFDVSILKYFTLEYETQSNEMRVLFEEDDNGIIIIIPRTRHRSYHPHRRYDCMHACACDSNKRTHVFALSLSLF